MNNNLFTSLNLSQHRFPTLRNMDIFSSITDMFISSPNFTDNITIGSSIIIALTISGSIIYYLNLPSAKEGKGDKENLNEARSVTSVDDTITSTDSASCQNVIDKNVGTSPISSTIDTNNSSNLSSSAEVLKDPLSVRTKFISTDNTSAQIREVTDANIGTSSINILPKTIEVTDANIGTSSMVNKEHLDQNIGTTSTLTYDTSTSVEQTLRTVADQNVEISQQLAIISDQNLDTISNLASTIIEYLL
jgi:hypothetical protein